MFLIIAFIKSFRNVTPIFFLELFGHEHKFKNMIWELSWDFFFFNWEIILFLRFYYEIKISII
jgi:hypothetical protein